MMTKDEMVQVVEGYNGWKNYETWNVALWIGNDEGLYALAKKAGNYTNFQNKLDDVMEGWPIAYETPDSVAWCDAKIDIVTVNKMIGELA